MDGIHSLEPPNTIYNADRAMEIARIWVVDGCQHVRISSNIWEDPAVWGMMLVDLAKHVANIYEQRGDDKDKTMDRILYAFNAEIQSATDDPKPIE